MLVDIELEANFTHFVRCASGGSAHVFHPLFMTILL